MASRELSPAAGGGSITGARSGANQPTDQEPAHVLVVDDDQRLLGLLQRYLSEAGFFVTTAADAAAAKEQMGRFSFDLIVMDVMMPGQSGLELTGELRATSNVPILLLTARGEPEDRILGFEHGADDYMPKPFEPRELVLRMHSILRRAAPAPAAEAAPVMVRLGAFVYDTGRGQLHRGETLIRLTSGEHALLRELAKTPNRPVSREELADRCEINSARAVDVQITRLRRKLETEPREPRYVQTVRGTGYMLVPE
ncbi:MAG: response regulator [Alphaproteobacteria bacterium]